MDPIRLTIEEETILEVNRLFKKVDRQGRGDIEVAALHEPITNELDDANPPTEDSE